MSQDPTGIVLVDKPKGITSFGVLNKIKKKFGIKKIGHAGTLDPDATGLLIVLLGSATKLQRFITDERKTYSGEITLGISTNSDDSTGEVTSRETVPEFTESDLRKVVTSFIGEHLQRPPAFSAIKKDGVRAYELARKGEIVELEERPVSLYSAELKIVSVDKLSYRITCSKGFYVRSFARDLASKLGTLGMTESIRRESSAGVDLSAAIELEALLKLEELPILPVTNFLSALERVSCTQEEYAKLIQGKTDVVAELDKRIESNDEALLVLGNSQLAGVLGARKTGTRAVEFLVPGL